MGSKLDYFTLASNWADDIGASMQASINRYKIIVSALVITVLLLLFMMLFLIPEQHLEPILINHYIDGSVSVAKLTNKYRPSSDTEVKSDIISYIINRESYDYGSYRRQFNLVTIMSSYKVADIFHNEQQISNKKSLLSILGKAKYRTVHIDNVVFLDKSKLNSKNNQRHRNLAQVDFSVTTHSYDNDANTTIPCRVIISWRYVPKRNVSAINWNNWSGFEVTFYQMSKLQVGV